MDISELYDLENDLLEMHNLWHDPAHAQTRAGLSEAMVMAMVESQDTSPRPTDFA